MSCKKCGSENMVAQAVTKGYFKQGHGCLWLIFFGWLYVIALFFKWMYKYLIIIMYYVCVAWVCAIVCAIKKKKYENPQFIKNLFRRRGKMYNDESTIFVCQNCGNRQNSK
jgi:hypothetical protein